MSAPEENLRLNRFLARAGLGSRRAVEELVRAATEHGEILYAVPGSPLVRLSTWPRAPRPGSGQSAPAP